jgi:hypothetical protein
MCGFPLYDRVEWLGVVVRGIVRSVPRWSCTTAAVTTEPRARPSQRKADR